MLGNALNPCARSLQTKHYDVDACEQDVHDQDLDEPKLETLCQEFADRCAHR